MGWTVLDSASRATGTEEQKKFIAWAKATLPKYFSNSDRAAEMITAMSAMFEAARLNGELLFTQTLISSATSFPPDFLNLHALDRGTSRQFNEGDISLRDRLINIPDALTLNALIDAVQSVLDQQEIVGTAAILELRYNKGFFGEYAGATGTGGSFVAPSNNNTFEPTAGWEVPPQIGDQLIFSGALSAGNNGSYTITDVIGNTAQFTNVSGVTETDPTVSWTHNKLGPDDVIKDGFAKAFFTRGFRMTTSTKNVIIAILPYGCTAATEVSVREALRKRKGATVIVLVECRQSP